MYLIFLKLFLAGLKNPKHWTRTSSDRFYAGNATATVFIPCGILFWAVSESTDGDIRSILLLFIGLGVLIIVPWFMLSMVKQRGIFRR